MSDPTQPAETYHPRQSAANPTTARVELPAEEFALAGLFEHAPDARAELTPTIAQPDNHALLDLRTTNSGRSTVETGLQGDPNIATADRYGTHDNGWMYGVTWANHARTLLQQIRDEDSTLLTARAHEGQWRFRLVTPDRATLSRLYEAVREHGYSPECQKISSFEGQHPNAAELTDDQRETLVAGLEAGYYNIPRDLTAKELADRLGVSHQALSERLRRAYRGLIESVLVDN
jgi:predicted DNA binding protein